MLASRTSLLPRSRVHNSVCVRACLHTPGLIQSLPQHGHAPRQGRLRLRPRTNLQQFSLTDLTNMVGLLAEAFADERQSPPMRLLFGCRVLAFILCTFAIAGRNANCMLAYLSSEEASEQPGCEVLAGMVTVHMVELREGPGSMPKALSLPEGTPLALVANMAVRRQSRRQGLAKSMLCAAEALVQQQFYPAPTALALLVHKGNHPAVSLYNTLGYQEAPGWVDPSWLEDAHKGRVGAPRRLLFAKPASRATHVA